MQPSADSREGNVGSKRASVATCRWPSEFRTIPVSASARVILKVLVVTTYIRRLRGQSPTLSPPSGFVNARRDHVQGNRVLSICSDPCPCPCPCPCPFLMPFHGCSRRKSGQGQGQGQGQGKPDQRPQLLIGSPRLRELDCPGTTFTQTFASTSTACPDNAQEILNNLAYISPDEERAERELKLWFPEFFLK